MARYRVVASEGTTAFPADTIIEISAAGDVTVEVCGIDTLQVPSLAALLDAFEGSRTHLLVAHERGASWTAKT